MSEEASLDVILATNVSSATFSNSVANSKFAIYLRATGTLRFSPDVGLRRWIVGISPRRVRIESVVAAWILS